MNSEGRYVSTGPQNEEPGGEAPWRAGGEKYLARRRANYQPTEFILNIIGMNHWMISPMRRILLLMVTFPNSPRPPLFLSYVQFY